MSAAVNPIVFAPGRTIPSPEVTALMLQLLDPKAGEKILEIGTGSGTQTSRWASTGAEIHTIELEPVIEADVVAEGIVYLHSGNGVRGLPREAPFDAIVVTCGVEAIPRAWIDQIRDGGRLIAPVGDASLQRLTLYGKSASGLEPKQIAAYVRFSMMRQD